MIKEIENAVCSIEQDIFEQTGCEYFNVTVISNGFCQIVKFIGIDVWNSEDDMREYADEDGCIYEDIEVYLRRGIRSELAKLGKISV